MIHPVEREKVEEFFFSAMLGNSWASDGETTVVSDMPGFEIYEFVKDGFRMRDMFCVYEHASAGMTIIWYKGTPVWRMQYYGWYVPEAIPLLKLALLTSYQSHQFFGGRGPSKLKLDKLTYKNKVVTPGFWWFKGDEIISKRERGGEHRDLGSHGYSGGLLFV